MVKRKTKKWISATISKEMDDVVRQKAQDLFGGNYSRALDHVISVYQSIWTDIMRKIMMTEIYEAYEKVQERDNKGTNS